VRLDHLLSREYTGGKGDMSLLFSAFLLWSIALSSLIHFGSLQWRGVLYYTQVSEPGLVEVPLVPTFQLSQGFSPGAAGAGL
jgi:hypothetical protein